MGVAGGVENLPWLFAGSLTGMLLLNPPFAWLVGADAAAALRLVRLPLLRAEPRRASSPPSPGATPPPTSGPAGSLFVWTSVFNMFVVSIFWSVMADVFSAGAGQAAVRLHRRRRHHRRHHRRRRSPRAWSGCSAPPTCCWCRRCCSKWRRCRPGGCSRSRAWRRRIARRTARRPADGHRRVGVGRHAAVGLRSLPAERHASTCCSSRC